MKQRPSGKDKDIPVFEFAFGLEELKLLIGLSETAIKNIPSCEDGKPMRNRLYNISKVMAKTLREYKNN